MIQEFGQEYLNRCPTTEEIKQTLQVNSNRGFPGLFASWDCKQFPWDMCPMAKAGQHKGKEKKNTLILEAICDPDTYILYSFFGEPGSLNDLNILEKLTIVGSILNGMMELRLPQNYSIPLMELFIIIYISLLMGSTPSGQYSFQLFQMQFQDQKTRCLQHTKRP